MASGDTLKRMLLSYQRGDHPAFRMAAEQLIGDERRKKHYVLADELQRLLDFGQQRRPLHSPTLKPLPKAREHAPLLDLINPHITFDDLILPADTVATLAEVCQEFRKAEALHANGIEPRTRLLFLGPPGCGKTATAEALASELGIPMAKVQLGAVVSSLLGETARNLESIFEFCSHGSWVLVFDELDSLAKERADRSDHGELKRVVTAFLQILDDYRRRSLVVATTNHAALLDLAVWRRFDDVVEFDLPSDADIVALLRKKFAAYRHQLPLPRIAEELKGLSPGEIESICYAALRHAILRGEDRPTIADVEHALANARRRWQIIRNFRSPG